MFHNIMKVLRKLWIVNLHFGQFSNKIIYNLSAIDLLDAERAALAAIRFVFWVLRSTASSSCCLRTLISHF